jgi:hypothetical protein
MKKQSKPSKEATSQLGFELESAPVKGASSSTNSEIDGPSVVSNSVVDFAPILNRRAAESERSILKAVQSRADHLSDCLLKRRS